MKIKLSLITAVCVLMIIASCSKSSTPTVSNPLLGSWYFIFEQGTIQNTTEYTSSGTDYKMVSVSGFTSADSSGGLTITSNIINAVELGYKISGQDSTYNYQNGQPVDTVPALLNQTVAPANASYNYQLVGSDSIYFPSGSFVNAGLPQTVSPGGAKFNIQGDTLYMSFSYSKDSSVFLYGMPATLTVQATVNSKFLRL
jgi:hypothetical protein